MYACFCGSIIQCVVKQPTFAPCHLLFYLTDVADDMNNMPCTLSKIDTMIFFALHLCLLCWHGNPVVWWSSPHYEQCQIMLLIFWTYSLFSNLKLDRIDRTVIIFVYTRGKHVIFLLCFRVICLMACTNPTYIAAKKAKHLEDSETTPKSCLDAVFKLLETNSQTSSQNSLSESVRLL